MPIFTFLAMFNFQIAVAGKIERNASQAPLKAVCAQPRYCGNDGVSRLKEMPLGVSDGGKNKVHLRSDSSQANTPTRS